MVDPDSPVLDFDTPFDQGGLLPPGLDAVVSATVTIRAAVYRMQTDPSARVPGPGFECKQTVMDNAVEGGTLNSFVN